MMQYLASGPIVAGMLLAVSVTIVGAAQGAQPGGVGPEHTVSVPDAAPQVLPRRAAGLLSRKGALHLSAEF